MSDPAHRLATYVQQHRAALLGRLRARLGAEALAEDVLHDSLLRALPVAPDLSGDRLAAWFDRVLRNATVDVYRRRAAAGRALDAYEREAPAEGAADPADARPCGCVAGLVPTLAPADADLIGRLDLGRETPAEAAERLGLTRNALAVRHHRARRRLRQRVDTACGACAARGCTDCTCA